VTRLFEKEYGLPVNSNPTDPRSRVRTFRMAALFSDHRFTSAQIALLEQVRWSNAYAFEGSAIIRAGEVDTPIAAGHTRYGTDEMDFDPVCVDYGRTVVCRAQDRAGEGTGYARQLGRGRARTCLLVRMGGVHTAGDWSGQTVPVDGAKVCTSYSDPHHRVARDGSPGLCHRILSEPWTSAVSFTHN